MKNKIIFALILLTCLLGCANRSKLSPDKAMLGQWKSVQHRCYISADKIIWQDLATGDRRASKYKIENVNDTERTVAFAYPEAQLKFGNTFKFSADNKSFQHIREYLEDRPDSFTYVDDKQEP
jgi:hypothetical protein